VVEEEFHRLKIAQGARDSATVNFQPQVTHKPIGYTLNGKSSPSKKLRSERKGLPLSSRI
jgi:hypothetical protein